MTLGEAIDDIRRILETLPGTADRKLHRRIAYQVTEGEYAQLKCEYYEQCERMGMSPRLIPSDGSIYLMGVLVSPTLPNRALDAAWGAFP